MTDPILTAESTLTDRYQTTVPQAVREALHLQKRGKIHYQLRPNGDVVLSRVGQEEADPAISRFLAFLSDDLLRHPERIQAVSEPLADRLRELVADVEIDLDAPLDEDDE